MSVPHPAVEQSHDHPPVGFVTTSLDGTVLSANDTFLDWLGTDRASVAGLRRIDQLMTAGSRVVYLTHHVPRLEEDGQLAGVSIDFRRLDGSTQPTFLASYITVNEHGNRVIKVTLFDATERRAFELELMKAKNEAESSAKYLSLLHEVASVCARSVTAETVALAVVSAAARGLSATAGALWTYDDDAGALVRMALVGTIEDVVPDAVPIDSSDPIARAFRTATTHAATPETAEPALAAVMDRIGIDAKLCVPLPFETSVLGVIALYLRRTEVLLAADVALVETLGHQVGQALERSRLMAELERKAMHDALTGLPNRVLLRDRIAIALARADREDQGVCVFALDLNGFKDVNDRLGHAAGDAVLAEVAQRLQRVVRPADTVARLGGDEFVIVCEGVGPECGERMVERLNEAIQIEARDGDVRLLVTASVGYARHEPTDEPITVEALLEQADAAMYRVKQQR